jgi:hypothetical protein
MTIRQIFKKYSNLTSLAEDDYEYLMDEEDFTNATKELIEFHIQAALKIVYDISELNAQKMFACGTDYIPPDKYSILNSYPLDLIK